MGFESLGRPFFASCPCADPSSRPPVTPSSKPLFQPSTPKRAPAYPSNLSKTTDARLAEASRWSDARAPAGGTEVRYQSLEELLAQAGYADTRVITPEAVRIKERVQRLWAEEKARTEREERDEVEGLLFGDERDASAPTAGFPPLKQQRQQQQQPPASAGKRPDKDGSFGGWSIGRAQGARLLEEGPTTFASPPRPLRTRGSALGLTFAAADDATNPSASASQGQPRSSSTTAASRHTPADDCGSLSSASSTASSDSTMITSPPESATETFVRVQTNSPPDLERSVPLVPSDPYGRMLSGSYDQPFGSSSSARSSSSSTAQSAPRPIPAPTAREDDVPQSAAARSLRKIASQTTLRKQLSFTSTSTRTVRPKPSLAKMVYASAVPRPAPVPEEPTPTQSTLRKALRHAASTPFLRSATATISSSADVKGKAPEGWFASLSRFALARTVGEPVAAAPALRTRPSIPSFRQSHSGVSSLRGAALPATVTKHSVTCVSDEGDDLPPFAASRIRSPFFPEDDDDDASDAAPRTPPVLTPRVEYGEAEAWTYGCSARSTPQTPQGGWAWNVGPSSAVQAPEVNITSPTSSTASPPSSPLPPRPLKAQRSIKSLRAALLAHPAPTPPPVPPLPPAHIRIPVFAISSPDTVERGLPPRTLDLSDEAISRMGKGRWHGADEDDEDACEADDIVGPAAAAADARGRTVDGRGQSKRRASSKKGVRR